MRSRKKLLVLGLGLLALAVVLGGWWRQRAARSEGGPTPVPFSTFVQAVERAPQLFAPAPTLRILAGAGHVAEVQGRWADGNSFTTVGYVDRLLLEKLSRAGVGYELVAHSEGRFWSQLPVTIGFALLLGLLLLVTLQLRSGAGLITRFGKSRAKRATSDQRQTTFADVAGVDEARGEVEEIIAFLREPKKFSRLGGRIPRGVLLTGPPGTGKTLLARAIAGEAGVPFFSMSGSDFVEMFVGVGASRVRSLFQQAKTSAPCIIFVDELDAVGRSRGLGMGGGHDEREQTLNQLLVEMDGFASNDGVILIAATNRPDVLDPALLRPGRFDRQMVVPPPDVRGREGILKVHTRKTPLAADVDLHVIARGTSGFVGAELASLVNEAALGAARLDKGHLEMSDFELAKDRVLMGPERRSLVIGDADRRAMAYYQAGHAVVGKLVKGADPIHKVTIIPRGRSLGLTQQLPIEDRWSVSREAAEDQIALNLGGRAAEELFLGRVTTGAAPDIERATSLARRMVSEWGMSDRLGPLFFGRQESLVFLGRDLGEAQPYSEQTAGVIDAETSRIVNENQQRARRLVHEHRDTVERVANALLERETISGADLDLLFVPAPPHGTVQQPGGPQ